MRPHAWVVTLLSAAGLCLSSGLASAAEPTPPATPSQAPARGTEGTWHPNGTVPPQEVIERLIHARGVSRSPFRASAPPYRNVTPLDWARLRAGERPHRQPHFIYFVLAGTALLMMLMTLSSMAQRFVSDFRIRQQSRTFGILPAGPVIGASTLASRTIRIDANQPQTRLGIDLAIFERAGIRHALGPAALRDPTPRAA